MSAPVTTPASGPLTGGWRRHRTKLLLAAAVVVAVGAAVLSAGSPTTSATYDPDNPSGAGSRATAQVLRDHGVDVRVVRSADELEAADVNGSMTVLVTSAELLGRSTVAQLRTEAAGAQLVVVEPGPGTTRALGAGVLPTSAVPETPVAADCDDPLLTGLSLEVDRALAYPESGCFGVEEGQLVAEPRQGLVLFGAGDALRNDQVVRGDNAAVVLRLLGHDHQLVWYVPSATDLVAGDGVSLETLLPAWLRPALLLVLLGAAALVVWRARRLGPLAVEPLPVVLKALETTRNRARLYQRAGAREHAADTLRRATRRRLAAQLAWPDPDDPVLVDQLSARLDRPRRELAELVTDRAPAPATDRDLITLAGALAALEEEVRRP